MTLLHFRALLRGSIAAVGILTLSAPSGSSVLTLQPVKDNTLIQNATGDFSNGKGLAVYAGLTALPEPRRALLAFDVSPIHPGYTVNSVRLTLHMAKTTSAAHAFELHRVLANWGEGTSVGQGGGAPSTPGDATWIHTFYNTSFWTNAGGDFAAAASAVQSVNEIGFYTWGSTAGLVADVQAWVDNPGTNFGWLLLGDEISLAPTSKAFDSREAVNRFRPSLTIDFTRIATEVQLLPAAALRLEPNFPNPFNPRTTLQYVLPRAGRVRLTVEDVRGGRVATLVEREQATGGHEVAWDGRDAGGQPVASGVYVVSLESDGQTRTRRIVLAK
jgi:hypothetical protein